MPRGPHDDPRADARRGRPTRSAPRRRRKAGKARTDKAVRLRRPQVKSADPGVNVNGAAHEVTDLLVHTDDSTDDEWGAPQKGLRTRAAPAKTQPPIMPKQPQWCRKTVEDPHTRPLRPHPGDSAARRGVYFPADEEEEAKYPCVNVLQQQIDRTVVSLYEEDESDFLEYACRRRVLAPPLAQLIHRWKPIGLHDDDDDGGRACGEGWGGVVVE